MMLHEDERNAWGAHSRPVGYHAGEGATGGTVEVVTPPCALPPIGPLYQIGNQRGFGGVVLRRDHLNNRRTCSLHYRLSAKHHGRGASMNRRYFMLGFPLAGCGWSGIGWPTLDGGMSGDGMSGSDGSWGSEGLESSDGGADTEGPIRGGCPVWGSDDVSVHGALVWADPADDDPPQWCT